MQPPSPANPNARSERPDAAGEACDAHGRGARAGAEAGDTELALDTGRSNAAEYRYANERAGARRGAAGGRKLYWTDPKGGAILSEPADVGQRHDDLAQRRRSRRHDAQRDLGARCAAEPRLAEWR